MALSRDTPFPDFTRYTTRNQRDFLEMTTTDSGIAGALTAFEMSSRCGNRVSMP
jgi:hypothetical protein